jgi:hypothetical protein
MVHTDGSAVEGNEPDPSRQLVAGQSGALFLPWFNWTGEVDRKADDVERIWGSVNSLFDAPESEAPSALQRGGYAGPAIVRGKLMWRATTPSLPTRGEPLDIDGRKLLDLKSGANNVRDLAPGMYFVSTCKIMITK